MNNQKRTGKEIEEEQICKVPKMEANDMEQPVLLQNQKKDGPDNNTEFQMIPYSYFDEKGEDNDFDDPGIISKDDEAAEKQEKPKTCLKLTKSFEKEVELVREMMKNGQKMLEQEAVAEKRRLKKKNRKRKNAKYSKKPQNYWIPAFDSSLEASDDLSDDDVVEAQLIVY
ncbi:unnamed protein product [Caenorhabditis sp. 36 PRJEB53466]|nr:unnamed protein product [Caenorhabditis sp. 36 PRJEB53466]